jgi:anti-sigma factor RsiW
MRCEQARQLFDAYLDGELSTGLATELGAHRLKCASCRRELALLEVSGHIIRSDSAASGLPLDFTDRLMQCVQTPRQRRLAMLRKSLLVGGPVAAAAVIVLAFAGFFDGRGTSKVAGVSEINPHAQPARDLASEPQASDRELQEWLDNAQRNVDTARRTGESLQNMLDSTLIEVLDVIEEGEEQPASEADDQLDESAPTDPSASEEDGPA